MHQGHIAKILRTSMSFAAIGLWPRDDKSVLLVDCILLIVLLLKKILLIVSFWDIRSTRDFLLFSCLISRVPKVLGEIPCKALRQMTLPSMALESSNSLLSPIFILHPLYGPAVRSLVKSQLSGCEKTKIPLTPSEATAPLPRRCDLHYYVNLLYCT